MVLSSAFILSLSSSKSVSYLQAMQYSTLTFLANQNRILDLFSIKIIKWPEFTIYSFIRRYAMKYGYVKLSNETRENKKQS